MSLPRENATVCNASLVTSFDYLLQKLGRDVKLEHLQAHFSDLEPDEDPWLLISLFDQHVQAAESGGYGTWPTGNNSVIRFQYQDSEQPYTEGDDGEKKANIVDHYCVVADAGDHQIIDSADGVLKNGNIYGNPLEWKSFEVRIDAEGAAEDETPGSRATYKVLKGGQNCWEISRRLSVDGLTAQSIADHNGIVDAQATIAAGTLLHLPFALPLPKERKVRVEALGEGWAMHVSKVGGTRKYAFGNVQKLEDLKATGPMCAEGRNITIYGIAHVPIGDEDAAFYLEANAMGDYKKTGNIAWAVGFNHSHLDDGHLDHKNPKPQPQVQEIIQAKLNEAQERQDAAMAAAQAEADKLAALPPTIAPEPQDEPEHVNPNAWKTTYKPFKNAEGLNTPRVYLFNEDTVVEDLSNGKKVHCYNLDGVLIGGPFEGPDGKPYLRPQDSADQFTWFGVDPERVVAEDEVFSSEFPIEERVVLNSHGGVKGKLTRNEKYVTVPLFKLMGRNPRIRGYINRQIKKVKE